MGLFKLFSSGSEVGDTSQSTLQPGNPNPARFTIVKTEQCGMHLVAWVRYHGVTNYEGNKILVFLNREAESLYRLTWLDPHFDDKVYGAPFARFEPTKRGWYAAIRMLDGYY